MANTKIGLLIAATRAIGSWRLVSFLMSLKESKTSAEKMSASIAMWIRWIYNIFITDFRACSHQGCSALCGRAIFRIDLNRQ